MEEQLRRVVNIMMRRCYLSLSPFFFFDNQVLSLSYQWVASGVCTYNFGFSSRFICDDF
jgi:hypothetical protein